MHPRRLCIGSLSRSLLAFLLVPALAQAGQKPKEWNPDIVPGEFQATVDNPYFPLSPGSVLRYQSKDGSETLVVEVTSRTRTVMGVRTVVVVETHAEDGQVVEVSENWFAQHRDGTVWYFGEDSQEFVGGSPAGSSGSWEAGVGGALPGIIMMGDPIQGDTYFQEFAEGVAEDMASVHSIGIVQGTALRVFSGVLKTKEWTTLEANSVEHKYYAPGVGLIREEKGGNWLELVAME